MSSLGPNWWALASRGLLAIVFGLVAMFVPGVTLLTLSYLFGAYALGDGLCAVVSGVRAASTHGRWQSFVLEGIVGIGAGLVVILVPAPSIKAFMMLFGAYAIVTGVYEVISAVRLRDEIEGEWLLGAAGVASVAFGILFIASPLRGGATLIYGLGAYALVFGGVVLGLSLRLRQVDQGPSAHTPQHA